MNPRDDKKFFKLIDFPTGQIYYVAFGNNPYRIVFAIDSNLRRAYFLALDPKHEIRKT